MAEIYGTTEVSERHRHRYEVNNAYRDRLESAGLHISGTSPDSLAGRVRRDGPRRCIRSLVATQAHPEFKSRPTRPHPLFVAFVGAALDYLRSERLPIDTPVHQATTDEPVAGVDGVGAASGDPSGPVDVPTGDPRPAPAGDREAVQNGVPTPVAAR